MDLIIGGAYQGKLDYAKEKYGLTDSDIFECSDKRDIEFKACVHHLERFTLYCVKTNLNAVDIFALWEKKWKDCVLICEDISCGVVPIDPEMREWREATGRLLNWLTPRAETVTRLFCGLPQRLK